MRLNLEPRIKRFLLYREPQIKQLEQVIGAEGNISSLIFHNDCWVSLDTRVDLTKEQEKKLERYLGSKISFTAGG